MINLETPEKLDTLTYQAHMAAEHVLRPISRKYDSAEHTYPVELDTLAELVAQANAAAGGDRAQATIPSRRRRAAPPRATSTAATSRA